MLFEHYGLSREMIESWGGKFFAANGNALTWFITSGDYDMIVDAVYAAYTEARHWWEASVRHELRFLPLPDDLIQTNGQETGGEPGPSAPAHARRGRRHPSVARSPHVIYGRDDLPEDFAFSACEGPRREPSPVPRGLPPVLVRKPAEDRRAEDGIPVHAGAQRATTERWDTCARKIGAAEPIAATSA